MYRDDEKKFDIRVIEKHVLTDAVSRDIFMKLLKDLPDVASKADEKYHFSLIPGHQKRQAKTAARTRQEGNALPENETGSSSSSPRDYPA